jgi:adenosine deaminase
MPTVDSGGASPGLVPEAPDAPPLTAAHAALFRGMPKAELHCHLLGSVRQATFLALAAKSGAPLSREEIDAFYRRGERPVGVLAALRALDAHLVTEPGDLHRITYEYLEDAAAHGVRYSEFFWNPTGTVRDSHIAYPAAQSAIVAAIYDAERDHGVVGRLVPSIDREAAPAEAEAMVRWVTEHRVAEVVGIGMDYREVDHPPEWFAAAYRAARRAGLKCTAHAGEFGMPWQNVQSAVELLQCDRIDHGYTVVDNPALARALAERGIVFTVVPTNSYYLRTLPPDRWALDHPIRRMRELGLALHPNTDDPTLHHVTPSGAWQLMFTHLGCTIAELRGMMLNGLRGAWIDESTRRSWSAAWTVEFDALARRVKARA